MSPIVFENTDTQRGVQQDRVGPAPTVFGPLTDMLVPQAKKSLIYEKVFDFLLLVFFFINKHNPKPPIRTCRFKLFSFNLVATLQCVYH